MYDKIIIGGGLVGLATALAIRERDPGCKLAVLEKEGAWALHQSSRNSGVIHAGVYYNPGSKKARFALAGNVSMFAFCEKHNIPYERCGKLIVATSPEQIHGLDLLNDRAIANGLDVSRISREAALELESHINCVEALHVPSTGIVDFKVVAAKYVELLKDKGVELVLDCQVKGIKQQGWGYSLASSQGLFQTKYLIATVGLYSDRMARRSGVDPGMKIIPFRGEYWHLKEAKRSLVKNLIYPVPNPNFPFLGVHMTRLIDGSVHAGPNAVLAFSREGYSWAAIKIPDLFETLTYPGFWKLAGTYLGEGSKEMYRSLVKAAFLRSVQELIPEIESDDLIRGDAGVRAQALRPDGSLIDDFHLLEEKNGIFVLNAPSPAATASLEIGKYIADKCYI
ncbi:MAG: L-2-hydroxyglutarate oxidase [Candidatus Marinimicrobia bacterium]|nr:L-2-hydroxyglutarate oxidase [Candidatus Neomarinimicrobiota bacterium]MBT3630851.1 L-2-hydroxyglutarate oxidase [Candidatus Neomarinimicrobiota bacterium]MBT3825225.1 L-2-hydroxyglutarate oxidase [Candidatus Neomarinimicrobiota bacterium]MBT4132543.1 L-2-hydroxyglutarate oxidase [Candidatus Neomarinimicrobiota bacterium]MBT4296424.1 L-2-hydroxyglutarate oxidase [Candidatus Neomarinimicrobiota bacterium]